MFDGLKKTLGRFRQDVEEAADEADEADAADASEETEEVEADEPERAEPSTDDAEPDDRSAEAADEGNENGGQAGFVRTAASFARGRIIIQEDDLEKPLDALELALLQHDVELGVAETLIERVRNELLGAERQLSRDTGDVIEDALHEALLSVLSVGEFDFDDRIDRGDKPVVIIFTGVNGVGKTTSIAKLSRYLEDRGVSTVLANGDTYRAGANEQLREHADRLGRTLITHEQGGDPAAVLYDAVEYAEANDVDVVLGDTAGRLHTNHDLMAQLQKIDRVVDPDVTLFVDEAVAGQDAVTRARQFNEAAAFDGTILTKADADPSGGAAISIAHVTGTPVLFLGTGQEYGDLEPFDPEVMADRLLADK